MNLVNTMINSIYVRRRELGIMQAIGLSEKQMVRMLQTAVLVFVVLLIQLLLTYLIIKNFRKQSMIERIRFSE